MQFSTTKRLSISGFTFAEVVVAMGIAVIFGTAAFVTNQRLLFALKSQRESTAATMMLQERMEEFRGVAYTNIGDPTYVSTNVLGTTTTSEAVLPNVTETIIVGGYMDTAGATPSPSPGATPTQNSWRRNAANPTGTPITTPVTALTTSYDLLKVTINLQWTSTDGRSRTRELAAMFGKGNIGQ
jgi:type II secretory pathway pseudopilin PulG